MHLATSGHRAKESNGPIKKFTAKTWEQRHTVELELTILPQAAQKACIATAQAADGSLS